MITQLGLFRRSQSECEVELISALIDSLRVFYHRSFTTSVLGPVIMASDARDANTDKAIGPFADSHVCVTSDARIDDPVIPIESTSAFVGSQFKRYGTNCWNRLEGDYALACWDARVRALHLVRDFSGARPLYIHSSPELAIWSSDLSLLTSLLGQNLQIDDDYIANYLIGGNTSGQTPYREIKSVLPGSVLTVSDDQERTQYFWDIQSQAQASINYRHDCDYEAHFRYLFAQSVERRLRDSSVALADLSGGLDSGSVVCVADDLMRSGRSNCGNLETVSLRYDGSPLSDESGSIALIEAQRGRKSHHLFEGRFLSCDSPWETLTRPDWWLLLPDSAKGYYNLKKALGADVLLCGIGGDEILQNSHAMREQITAAVKALQPIRCYRCIALWASAERTPIGHILRRVIRDTWHGWSRHDIEFLVANFDLMFANLDRDFVERFHCRDRMNLLTQFSDVKSFSLRHQYAVVSSVISYVSECSERELFGSNMSYPFLDRSLVQFLLAIPGEQKNRPGETKSLLRRAMRGVLPEQLRLRRHKVGGPTQAFMRAIRRNWCQIVADLPDAEIFRRGYAHRESFTANLNSAKHGLVTAAPLSIWKLLALETFLQARRRTRQSRSLIDAQLNLLSNTSLSKLRAP